MTRVCLNCKETKPLSAVYFHRQASGRAGFRSICKPCAMSRKPKWSEKDNERCKALYVSSPRYRWSKLEAGLRKSYGIDSEDWARMFEKQKGCCGICLDRLVVNNDRLTHVDHNHTTGKVRELLCRKCNSFIGLARESAKILKSALAYLERHNAED